MDSTTVLLVDDETTFLEMMEKRLVMEGARVLTASGGLEALATLSRCPDVDVVILDVHMPGMDGIQTLKEVRQGYPSIEVIMLSGRTTIESAVEGVKLGAFDYLIKPCPVQQIMAKVREAKAKKKKQEDKIAEARARESTLQGN